MPDMQLPSNHKDDLRRAYDADVERRGAMTPYEWQANTIDAFATTLSTADARTVLDLGCGTGQLAERLAGRGLDVTAVDISPANVQAARARGVEAQMADFASLPFPDDSFDAAFAMNSLIHVPPADLSAVLAEIARVLRPGALLLSVMWGGQTIEGPVDDEWLDPPRYFSFYTDEALLDLETPGFIMSDFKTIAVSEGGPGMHSQILTLEAT